jgi:tetratricopeptide (TPR) repeat protein
MKNLKFYILNFIFALCIFHFAFVYNAYPLNLDKIKTDFLRGDYQQAISEGEKALAASCHSDELYYFLGLCYMKEGNYLRASDIFEIILAEFTRSSFKEQALIGLGDTYFLRADFKKARQYYQEFLKSYPGSKFRASVLYRLSTIGFKEGDTQEASQALEKISLEFPFNPELRQNKDLCWQRNTAGFYYSVQVGSFANYANADNLRKKLVNQGYDVHIEEAENQGNKAYRIKVGRLKSRQEAMRLSDKLAQGGYPTKICP